MYGSESGNGKIGSIIEDRQGHVWFGIWGGGITRYDGTHFIHYTTREGLRNNGVWSLLEDSQGNIWIGSNNGSLTRYDGENFSHFTLTKTIGGATSLCEDSKGNIWIGTWADQKGVFRYDPDETGTGGTFTHFGTREGLSHNNIVSIREDSRGNIWLGTNGGGVNRYDPTGSGIFTHFTTEEGLADNRVWSIEEDRQGRMWFGTRGGVSCYDSTNFINYTTEEGLSSNDVYCIWEDSQGRMWFGTRGGGISRFKSSGFAHYSMEDGLVSNALRSLLADSRGNVWIGTWGGANQYDPAGGGTFTHYSTRQGLVRNVIYSMLEDKQGRLWFGTGRGGVSRYDPAETGTGGGSFTTFTEAEGLSGIDVRYMLEDSRGNIWLRTYMEGARGVTRYDPDEAGTGGSFTHFTMKEGMTSDTLNHMIEDSRGRLWFATDRGVSCYDPAGEGTITHYATKEGLLSNRVSHILEDSRGNIWFATDRGLSRYDPDSRDRTTGSFIHYTAKNGLGADRVRRMVEDSRGNLWLNTDRGLSRYDPDQTGTGGRFVHYSTENGLSDNRVRSIVADEHENIWVATRKGLNVFVPPSGASPSAHHGQVEAYQLFSFGMDDGLEQVNFSPQVQLDTQNRVWWGTDLGVTMLDVNQFHLPTTTPEIRLRTIQIKERFVDYRRLRDTAYQHRLSFGVDLAERIDSVAPWYNYPANMTLPHDLNHLTFQISGIDWAAPHQLKYSYMMEGLDEDWSLPTPENKADYRNLSYGTYTFQVKAMGAAQIWSEPFEYRFTILPPWWLTWWAYTLYSLAFVAALWTLRSYEMGRQQLRHQLELENVRAEKLEEINQLKSRFFANISHEFRTPLTLILGMARQIKDDPKKWYQEGLQMITRNGQQLLSLVNQMLDLSKLDKSKLELNMQQGEVMSFIHYMVQSFESLAAGKNIQLHFLKENDQLNMDLDPDQLTKILNNLLSNAVKYTPEGGQVYVMARSRQVSQAGTSEVLELRVKDTGPGIPPKELPHIFDRFYQVDSSATRKVGGTGLGLALTRELVQLMGGNIQVQSKIDEGTDFIVLLPVNRSAPTSDTVKERAGQYDSKREGHIMEAAAAAIAPISDEQGRAKLGLISQNGDLPLVLLIEDNRDVLTYLTSSLEAHYQLEFATNGQEGIEQALKIVPDIVISDIMMPEKDGYEVCTALKADIGTSHVPIILLTAKADRDARLEGLKAGADAYLTKPFDPEELQILLRKLLESRRQLQARYSNLQLTAQREKQHMNQEVLFLQKLRKSVEENLSDEDFGIAQLCRNIGVSRSQLHNKLKALTGQPASIYIRSIRLEKAKTLLRSTDLSISEVAYEVGFRTPLYFTQVFSEQMGVAPSVYRNNE